MDKITVRQAVLSDIDAIVPMLDDYRRFYGYASDDRAARNFLLARFNHGESTLFIAHEENKPVGFAQLYPSFSSAALARTFILNDLYVRENARRKGVGSQLIAACVEFAKSLAAVRLTLSTEISNQAAQALYQRTGWKRDDRYYVYHFTIQT